jgi:hypothetical protein
MRSEIILIGPVRTGKSTLGRLLADKLGLPQVSLDELRWEYYKEVGYDEVLAREFLQRGGFPALALYWQFFDIYSVERVLADYHHCVFDFGAGVGVYESREHFARAQQALRPFRNVILLLPSPDIEESIRTLHERDRQPPADLNFDFQSHFLRHHGYYDLAKFTVYTEGRPPEESCAEILRRIA